MLLCEVVKLLIELAGLFYNLPGVDREGCLPRAGLGAACQLGEGSSFPGAAPQAHSLLAPAFLFSQAAVALGILYPVLLGSFLALMLRSGTAAQPWLCFCS